MLSVLAYKSTFSNIQILSCLTKYDCLTGLIIINLYTKKLFEEAKPSLNIL